MKICHAPIHLKDKNVVIMRHFCDFHIAVIPTLWPLCESAPNHRHAWNRCAFYPHDREHHVDAEPFQRMLDDAGKLK